MISAQYTKTELEEIEEVTRKSITDCAELKELFKSAIKHIQKSKGFCHPSPEGCSRTVQRAGQVCA